MNIATTLLQQAADRPDQPAIIEATRWGDLRITFAELDLASALLADRLVRRGVEPGQRVLVMLGMSINLYVALAAVLRAGMVAMFIDPSAGRGHLKACCRAAPPDVLLGTWKAQLLRVVHGCLRCVPGVVYPTLFGPPRTELRNPSCEVVPCGAEAPALLTFTSGSTATPKAAVRTHGLLKAQQTALTEAIDLQAGELDLATLPVFVLANLAAGVTSLIADADLRRPGNIDAGPVLNQIDKHAPTRCAASPAFFQRLVEVCEREHRSLGSLQQVFTGGAPVFPDLLERLARVMPDGAPSVVYGSTEAEPISHARWTDITPSDHAAMARGRGLLVGLPSPRIQVRVVDPDRLPAGVMSPALLSSLCCGPSEPGEILVTGDHVLKGYLHPRDDLETKLRIGDTVWHRTGDCGYLDDRGRLWLLGRVGARIIDGRGVLFPFAVECAARQVRGVRRAALCERGGKRVLCVEADSPESVDQVRERFGDQIDTVVPLDHIPLDRRHNAKVNYPELRRMLDNT